MSNKKDNLLVLLILKNNCKRFFPVSVIHYMQNTQFVNAHTGQNFEVRGNV